MRHQLRALKNAVLGLTVAATFAMACGAAPASTYSLYARLGGTANVTAVVNDVINDAASNPHLKRSFHNVDVARVKRLLVEQICELAGGGCKYSGDSMHDVHAGLGITQAEFYGMVADLKNSMQRHGIALRERNELLSILAPMKRDVVER